MKRIRVENPAVVSILLKAKRTFIDYSSYEPTVVHKGYKEALWIPAGEYNEKTTTLESLYGYKAEDWEIILVRDLPESKKTRKYYSSVYDYDCGFSI